jgi:hypothetical protein
LSIKKQISLNQKSYRSHDYKLLGQRWEEICNESGLRMKKILEIDSYPCFEVFSPGFDNENVIYLSAGIHGDESGATEGLLAWAESNLDQLRSLPLLIYPCLNPWGLVNNSRVDASGTDLNRIWSKNPNILIKYICNRTDPLNFQLVINLHEDFDGQGVYIYEPSLGGRPSQKAEEIISAAFPFLPPDSRRMIDGRRASNGIIRPRPSNSLSEGIPEALYFYLKHQCPTFTFETPSEFDLTLRTKAHMAMISQAL